MVSLKLKLLFFLLYLLSSIYIFIRFISSLLNPQFWFCLDSFIVVNRLLKTQFYYTNKMDCTGSIINKVEFVGDKVKIKVIIVLVLVLILVKLFLRRQAIYFKLNFLLVTIYSLILDLVYSVGSSSYKVLNNNLGTIVFLYFFTYILLVCRNI